MADLLARTPAAGLLPVAHGALTLDEAPWETITSLSPRRGRTGEVARVLPLPDPGRTLRADGRRVIWAGLDLFMVAGPRPEGLEGLAALTDQSDAWCRLRLSGPGVEAALARLTPLDPNPHSFGKGRSARTLMGHMDALLVREGREVVEAWVFRSMAGSAVHEVERAMRGVTAREALA